MNFEKKALLELAYSNIENSKPIHATDIIVDQIDKWLSEGQFDNVRKTLQLFDVSRVVPSVLTGILSLTWHVKIYLEPERSEFFTRVMNIFEARGVSLERRESIIKRLK